MGGGGGTTTGVVMVGLVVAAVAMVALGRNNTSRWSVRFVCQQQDVLSLSLSLSLSFIAEEVCVALVAAS